MPRTLATFEVISRGFTCFNLWPKQNLLVDPKQTVNYKESSLFFCLMIPRLILRRCLIGNHNNSQQKFERRPTSALKSGLKWAPYPSGRSRHEPKGSHSIASVIWEDLPTDAPIMTWQKAFSLPWLIGSTYLFLWIIYDIHGKYIDRSIYRPEDVHASPFLQTHLGIESTMLLIQSHQSSMRRTLAGGTV